VPDGFDGPRNAPAADTVTVTAAAVEAAEHWQLSTEPFVDIGGDEGRVSAQFETINYVAQLSTGETLVYDAGSSARDFRVFDQSGMLRRRFGRAGRGPGEFISVSWVAVDRLDSVRAYDFATRRVAVFSPAGELVRDESFGALPFRFRYEVAGVFATGSVLIRTTINVPMGPPGRAGVFQDTALLAIVSADRTRIDTIGAFPDARWFRADAEPAITGRTPFGAALCTAVGDSTAAIGTSATYEFGIFDQGGVLRRIVRQAASARPVSQSAIDAFMQDVRGGLGGERSAAQLKERWIRTVPVPRHYPAYDHCMIDRIGNFWIRDYYVDELPAPKPRWLVFRPDGRLRAVASIDVAGRFFPTDIGADYVAGGWIGTDDVPHARAYGIRKVKVPNSTDRMPTSR
jgi:hypothetical protein